MSEHLLHLRRRQVLDRPSVIERLIRLNLYFIQAQLGAAAMAAIGAVGFHRPAQPAGSSDRRDGEIKLPISGLTQGEQNNNIQTTNRPAASCDSRSKSWSSKNIKQCRRKKHTERDDEIGLINGTSTATDDEQTNNETTEDERAHEAIEDSSEWSRWSWRWKMSSYILIAFTVVGFPLLIVYLYHTYECAHKHRAHYHCINGTSPHRIPQKYALIIELNFVPLQLSCRAIFVAFCFRQTGWKGFKNIFLEKVFDDREYTFPLVGHYIASAARFFFLFSDEGHMGPHKQSGNAVISLYIIDDLGILIVICTLNYVKIKDLSENKKVQNGFTLVLFSFCMVTVLCLLVYFRNSDNCFRYSCAEGTNGKANNLLTLWGQLVYLSRIRDCLWHKLNGDEEPAIGVKSSDEKKSASQKPIRKVRWPIKTKWKHRTLYINGRRKMQSRGIQQKRVTPNGSKKSKTETQNEQRKSKTNNQ